jgi:hypothetical protein
MTCRPQRHLHTTCRPQRRQHLGAASSMDQSRGVDLQQSMDESVCSRSSRLLRRQHPRRGRERVQVVGARLAARGCRLLPVG